YIFSNDLLVPSTIDALLPERPVLQQNFPNPFNPQTTITFSLPAPAPVRLSVYSVAGKRVATLLDEIREPGSHEVVWNGQNDRGRSLPSGSYFYRLETDGEFVTRGMVLLK
ncbi:MAG: FlgD immunoglobulin-like domain containing protein, partial [bacterium]